MKINYILASFIISLLIACGEGKKERTQEEAEQKRIHLEKIEVGKSKLKMDLTQEYDRLKKTLIEENAKLEKINEFQLGRSSVTKEKQLTEQNNKILRISNQLEKLKEEISLTHLRETFEFQNTPKGVIDFIFEAAQNRDFDKLRHVCDPYGENDKDTRYICLVAMQPVAMQNQFVENFKNGRIMGETQINGNKAETEIAIGSSSQRLVTITLVKRMNKWYLESF
ncbi:hypothetical protein INR76_07895 [Marixanthomonas sp. SCSIO 43207]|uniref:hypothetical protein n=1 Tax=Marixanthomonas sp. SCSIO 43207 TaxID=2779360 RepID=UPI001CAA392D|nr:hypothetical protein [Marixanthomonas sp. SCSIO 43207]UAB80059.1 hypothetical protein INR76_07895 [Marixanthomonas sp. SCSIO 43207]